MTEIVNNPTVRLPPTPEWEDILHAFRKLGGVADNLAPGCGPSGRGLFVQDPAKPFLLSVPDNLLFRTGDIAYLNGAMAIREDTGVPAAERDFFERYQRIFFGEGHYQSDAAKLITMLDSLPFDLRATLSAEFGMQSLFEGDSTERIRTQHLRSRTLGWNDEMVITPLIELANRDDNGVELSANDDRLRIEGRTQAEILVKFGPHDSAGIFRKLGIAVARPHAYSLPMQTKVGPVELTIARNIGSKRNRAAAMVPELQSQSGKLVLSYLMVGNANFPRASRGIFYALMRKAEAAGAEEAFDLILHENKAKYLVLLEKLEPHQGEMITRLRRVAHFQLEALSQCVGAREP